MNQVSIIAEAGVNHNGSIDVAKQLVDVAIDAGADIVKFQSGKVENVVSRYAPKADYQKNSTDEVDSQFEMIKKLVLSTEAHEELSQYCKAKCILFLSTPFDLESVDLLDSMGLEVFKIPSGEITNLPYLRKIGKLNKKLIISTGMANLGEIEKAMDVLIESGTLRDQMTILHCNTEYPTPMEDVNLRAMLTIKESLKVRVGYSDHTLGIEVPIAAVALGASVIEKHFTLDRNMIGPDHQASLEPQELKAMVNAIRNIEKALGNGIKKASPSEQKNKAIARKSLVAKNEICKGELFSEDNITAKRPGTGISPMEWDRIIGKVAMRSFKEDDLIEL